MSLPDNVLRPTAADWSRGHWPAPFDCATLECRPRLALQGLGAHITAVPAGGRTCPLHAHAFEEKVFYVLHASLPVRELATGAANYREYHLSAGEAVVFSPGTGLAHCFYNRSGAEARFLGLSDDCAGEVATYPDSGKTLLRGVRRIGAFSDDGKRAIAAANEAARHRVVQRLAPAERPGHVVTDAPEGDLGGGLFGTRLSRAGGARKVMLNRDRLLPGAATAPLHWHSAEQELVLVLAGAPTLVQHRGEQAPPHPHGGLSGPPDFADATEQNVLLAPGDLVHFGPDLPLAHRIENRSGHACELLVVGLEDPTDVLFFPLEERFFVKALGRSAALTQTPYFEGEIPEPGGDCNNGADL